MTRFRAIPDQLRARRDPTMKRRKPPRLDDQLKRLGVPIEENPARQQAPEPVTRDTYTPVSMYESSPCPYCSKRTCAHNY